MTSTDATPIAIVGMSGRFPGADDVDAFWCNLADGVESITELTPDELRASGVPDDVARLPGYVNVAPTLGDVDLFDAGFFGFSARDASLTDPQHRLFLETAWETLEDAGYDPATYPGAIGVFGGCELSTYLYQLYQNSGALGYVDGMQLMVTNDKDHLCTQVSYRLNLRGPSVAVQTTCSTSLVAVAVACESLRARSCDLALAGGVTVRVPQRAGYFYTAGSILSPDGHCRPFDARAQGTVVGSGVGIVALKRLDDAVADDDSIRAVLLGIGINNDGSDKVGYTAPGFRGQVAAITAAYERAGVSPESLGYVEAHGTGTILGDPIELLGADGGVPAPHRPAWVLRDRVAEVERRSSVLRVGRGRADQDRADPAARSDPADGALPGAEPRHRLRRQPLLRHDLAAPVGSKRIAAARRRQLVRRRRHQRPRRARRGSRTAADARAAQQPDHHRVGEERRSRR